MVPRTNARGADIGAEFRQRKNILRSLLGQPQQFLGFPGGALPGTTLIGSALARRRKTLAPLADRLRELAGQNILTRPVDALCAAYVHLHVNRMSSPGSPSEERILSLLLRTRESLAKAPFGPAPVV